MFAEEAALLSYPRKQRPKNVAADWRMALVKVVNGVNNEANMLSAGVTTTDPFINAMTEVNKIAWNLRVNAGNDRRNLATAITQGRKLSAGQIRNFVKMNSRMDT